MKYRHLFWPILLIAIGTLFILNNFGIIEFGWRAIWNLWPLIFIFIGISILPVKDWIKLVSLLIVVAFTVIFFNRLTNNAPFLHFRIHDNSFYSDKDWNDDEGDKETATTKFIDQNLFVPMDSVTRSADLSLDAAAGNFIISDTSAKLLSFHKSGNIGNYSLTTRDDNGKKHITLAMEKARVHRLNENKVQIRLNPKTAWNMDFNIGAADMKMDLSQYKVDTITFDAGASSITLKLGDKSPSAHLTFSAGASSLCVSIPKESGCQIKSESFLASKDFKGFTKKEDGLYQTENFGTSKNKIYITVETAISSIEVDRY